MSVHIDSAFRETHKAMNRFSSWPLLLVGLGTAFWPRPSLGLPRFQLIDLGTLGGSESVATAVSDGGYVVGHSLTASGQRTAFRWFEGSMQNLGLLPTGDQAAVPYSTAVDVNDAGNVVGNGSSVFNSMDVDHAFWFGANDTEMSFLLPTPNDANSSIVQSVNNQNVAVGNAVGGTARRPQAFLRFVPPEFNPPDSVIGLTNLDSFLRGTGAYVTEDNVAFVWNQTSDFENLAAPLGHAADTIDGLIPFSPTAHGTKGVNSHYRHVTDRNGIGNLATLRSLFTTNGTVDLGALGMFSVQGINNLGQVVGRDRQGPGIARLYDPEENQVLNLNDLTDGLGDWTLRYALDISDRQWIVGVADDGNGNDRAFLLVPEREPNVINNGRFNIPFETPFRVQAEHRGWEITNPLAVGDWDLSGNGTDFAARFMPSSTELFGTQTNLNNKNTAFAQQFVDIAEAETTLYFDVRFDTVFNDDEGGSEFRLELNDETVWSVNSPSIADSQFTTYAVPIPMEYLGATDLSFRFVAVNDTPFTFEAGVPSGLLLDNIRMNPPPSGSGDFDMDGDVDGADFLKWQRGESPDPLSADDFAQWQSQFGEPGSSELAAAVPEPQGAALALAIASMHIFQRRRRPTYIQSNGSRRFVLPHFWRLLQQRRRSWR
jgi:probable HAF family extracellular repeat protein